MSSPTAAIDPATFAALAAFGLVAALAFATLRPAAVVGRPRLVLALVALLSVGAAAALVRLEPPGLRLAIDPSTEPLLPTRDPARELYREAVLDFGADEVFVIAMETDDVFRAERLARLRRTTDAIARLPGVRGVQSLTDVLCFRWEPANAWIEVRPFLEEIPSDPAALAELRRRALGDPLYRRNLVSDDGRAAAINVSFRETTDREFIASGLDATIRAILDAESDADVRFHVAGRPHVKVAVYERMLRDLRLLVPLAIAAMAGVLAVVFGSRRGVVIPLATVLLATLWTFGAMALVGRPLNVITSLLAPTLIAVGSVYGVHLLARFEEESLDARSPREAALRSLEGERAPLLIAGTTTVIGFGALVPSGVPAVFELGAFSVLGVAAVTLLSMSAVPAALALLPPARAAGPGGLHRASERLGAAFDAALTAIASFAIRRDRAILVAWSALALGAALLVPRIVVDTDYLSFFDAADPIRRDFESVNRLLSGAVPIYVPLRSDSEGRFRDPELLRALETLESRAAEIPGVSRVESVVDTLRVLNRALAGDDPREERIPESRGAVTELLFLAPKGHLTRLTNANQSHANLLVRTGAVGTAAVNELATRLGELLEDGVLPADVAAGVTGNAILLARSADALARSQPGSVGLAAGAILGLVTLGLRSWRLGLVAMVPNLVPVLCFFGLLGLGVAPLSLPTSLIGSVALGITIDDTVHTLVRYRSERRAGLSPEAAVLLTTRRVGRPIATTSLVLVAGFLVIALSGFATLREFGALSALTMTICLVCDLTLLPALLARTRV
ncbi:MAG TPA: MMPL family transporter [Myxococcota bacterium]|nr:MMPL family transporter [Myxococcota bacterium]